MARLRTKTIAEHPMPPKMMHIIAIIGIFPTASDTKISPSNFPSVKHVATNRPEVQVIATRGILMNRHRFRDRGDISRMRSFDNELIS